MRNIALRLRYDGSSYHGWQIQKDDISVCSVLNTALTEVCKEKVHAIGCGRTDAGVHALNYCANFKTNNLIPAKRIPLAVNTRLPSDVSVISAIETEPDFNAISSCIKKEYMYKVMNSRIRDPFLNKRACFIPAKLDFSKLYDAGKMFEGKHDFAAVRSVGSVTKSTVRTVHYVDAEKDGDFIIIKVCADGFLYNMARAIVGTMVFSALGKIAPEDIPIFLEKRDRRLTGPTMPPQGLYLSKLWYDGDVGEMMSKDLPFILPD